MKRFTETTKWSDPWFRKLDPKFKALWLYLVDSCDVAGVWNADLELASFHIGAEFEQAEIEKVFSNRLRILDSGKWFITKFIEYQYGELNPENNCHKAVLRSLAANGIEAPKKPLKRPSLGPQDKDKDKEQEGESEGNRFPEQLRTDAFAAVWTRWEKHRREIRKKLTPEMVAASLRRLAPLGEPRAIEIIEFTLAKGWQGLADDDKVPVGAASNGVPRSETPTWVREAKDLQSVLADHEGFPVEKMREFVANYRAPISEGGDAAKDWLKKNLTPWGLSAIREIWKDQS